MELSMENLLKKGNVSLAAGAIFSITSLACPCPICIGSCIACFLNAACGKLGVDLPFPKKHQD